MAILDMRALLSFYHQPKSQGSLNWLSLDHIPILEQVITFSGIRHLIGQQRRRRRRQGGKEKKKIGQGDTGDKQKCNTGVASLNPEVSCWFSTSILSQKFSCQDRACITDRSIFLYRSHSLLASALFIIFKGNERKALKKQGL